VDDKTTQGRWNDVPASYRVDILKDGKRWIDTVGVTATPDTIAATAVSLVYEAAVESRPEPGDCCCAEVYDDQDRFVLKAELVISDEASGDPPG
jgi:hypothetical protein